MEGSYQMVVCAAQDDLADDTAVQAFDVPIAPFSLHTPNALH
jgi:uncharacterized protein affecting Mg2+/Co2+ transport